MSEKKPISTEHSESSTRKSLESGGRFNVGRSAELLVAARLVELGFSVFFPFSDRSPVDLISSWEGHAQRVQVKARWKSRGGGGQDITITGVSSSNADALIVYIHKPLSFYVIPTKVLGRASTLIFYPSGRSTKQPKKYWDEWRDRWDILKGSPKCT